MLYVAFSGGKDSTALALRLHELGEPFEMVFTPTGNELPEVEEHIERVRARTGAVLHRPENRPLGWWIAEFGALPNPRQRWCTRLIKIRPCIDFLKAHPGATLAVGLRADEEERQGLYGEWAAYRYPLREWGWGLKEVLAYCRAQGVAVPRRTDCAVCPYQRLGDWWRLWRDRPDFWAQGERWEAEVGHTFRSPSRDTWPASMAGLRARFERGDRPRGADEEDAEAACRVCRL